MQLGIISNHPTKADGKGKGQDIEMGLVAYPESAFKTPAVRIVWRDTGNDYERPVIIAAPCSSEEQLAEVSAITKAVMNLTKKHGFRKAVGHPAHLLTYLEKQLSRHVVMLADGTVERVTKRKAGEKRYGANIGGEVIVVTAVSEKAAQSAINRAIVERVKGRKDKAAFAASMADWVVAGCPVKEVDEKVADVDVAPLTVYATAKAREKK